MDNANPILTERRSSSSSNVNGSVRRGGSGPGGGRSGPHLHISAPLPGSTMARPISLMDGSHNQSAHGMQMAPSGVQVHIVQVIVNKVEGGYGMKVSGDNPVFVQSVTSGGAAEKAGLHAGDKIVKVNSENVMTSTHTEVVALIRASSQVILTVQKRTGVPPRTMGSPNPELRPNNNPSNRITGPQPVDNEHQYQLQRQKEQYYRLMIEKEQRYVDTLRGDIAKSPDEKKCKELEKTESLILKLQMLLDDHTRNSNELQSISLDKADSPPPPLPTTPPPKFLLPKLTSKATRSNNNGNNSLDDVYSDDNPPPLPKRNFIQNKDFDNNNSNKLSVSGSEESGTGRGRCSSLGRRHHTVDDSHCTRMVDNVLYQHHVPSGNQSATSPPPLPPRHPSLTCPQSQDHLGDAANSINKQMSYPLVATCATIINNYPPSATNNAITNQTNAVLPDTHQRTKSSPESLDMTMSSKGADDASMMLIANESMTNLCGGGGYGPPGTPPGTPPPPYPSPTPGRRCYSNRSSGGNGLLDDTTVGDGGFGGNPDASSPDISPLRGHAGRIIANSSPIHAANPQTTQEMIMSMEDEDISDQEIIQMEDHGSFKSLSKLWESTPHLAVFMNYILSNSDPNSLLFYLLTDLYKEGNTKEMRKWAYEIHSCFLVPGAPLPLTNVDEQIAREIDDVLQREYDKEEILRRIFWKARNLAKQELQRQLAAFQQKRTAGLSTMYGPPDAYLTELRNDRAKELKMYETVLINKLEPYLKELEEDNDDPQKYIMAAALTTVVTRVFGVRPPSQDLDRCPTFVNKEKSFRTKLGIRFSRKLNILGHHFVAQPYFTVIRCSNCLQIICGISPQGYECSACHINLHRQCVRLFEDACPGPINNKKDRGMLNFIERIKPDKPEKDQRRKYSSNFLQREREECITQNELGDTKPGNPVSRSGSDRRPDAVREESQQQQQLLLQNQQQSQSQLPPDQQNQHQHQRVNSADHAHSNNADPTAHPDSSTSLPPSSGNRDRSGKINRTASLKEKQTDKKTQSKKPRNISDPLTSRHDSDQAEFTLTQSGGSSGSSSNSLRVSSISPSSSIDAGGGLHDIQHGIANDSDLDVGYELPDWSANIPHDTLAALTGEEKKRQELINEFFHTEQYHLRKLKILDKIFYGPLTHKKVFNECDMNLIFANLPELVEIHSCLNSTMKAKRKENPLVGEVGDFIFNMFDSLKGDELQRAAASFCERQHLALELITERRKKDQRVETALASCEKSHHCERQNLQSFMSAEMHRITRYPILIERLIETTKKVYSERTGGDAESQAEELERLRLALTRCKEIVNNVNETVRTASNRSKLQEIQNHLEILIEKQIESSGIRHEHNMFVSEYKNLDLTKYTLIREDRVELLRTNRNPINLQMLLLEEAVVFLVTENEKYTLKFIQSGIPATPFLAPIIKVPSFIVRLNAARNTTIFLLNLRAESTQMYELRAKSRNDRDVWFKQLSDAAEAYNRRESGRLRPRTDPASTSAPLAVSTSPTTPAAGGTPPSSATDVNDDSMLVDLMSSSSPTLQRKGVTPERSEAVNTSQADCSAASSSPTDVTVNRRNNAISVGSNRYRDGDDLDDKRLSQPDMEGVTSHTSAVGGGVMVKLEADDWSLVQPSEVQVAVPPVHTAQPVLTPLEKIKRKDEEVRQALADKRVLVADLLSIPLQDYHHIADMVSAESQKTVDSEPTELVLAAVHQVDILLNLMNESLNVNETDMVIASGGRHPSCTSNATVIQQQQNSTNLVPSVPVHRLQSIVPLLSAQLTNLLSLTKQGEEEKIMLRKELQRTRELLQVNAVSEEQDIDFHQEFCQSGDLERIDESPTETDTT